MRMIIFGNNLQPYLFLPPRGYVLRRKGKGTGKTIDRRILSNFCLRGDACSDTVTAMGRSFKPTTYTSFKKKQWTEVKCFYDI